MNWVPGVSQLKSVVQLVTGDTEGAAQTNKDFFEQCPIVSQVTSLAKLTIGDEEGAKNTFKKGLSTINNIANSAPIVGHVKSVGHLVIGDNEGAKAAFKSANRTTTVMAGGTAGFLVGGPIGAAAGGVAAGTAYDGAYTAVEGKPSGHFATIDRIEKDEHPAGATFDLAAGIFFDGLTGHTAGQTAGKVYGKKIQADAFKKLEQVDPLTNSDINIKSGDVKVQMENLQKQYNYGESLQGIKHSIDKFNDPITIESNVTPYIPTSIEEINISFKKCLEILNDSSIIKYDDKKLMKEYVKLFVIEIEKIINKELNKYNESFKSMLERYNRKKNPRGKEKKKCNKKHKLLTRNEANYLIKKFKLNKFENIYHQDNSIGGSYSMVSSDYIGRKGNYEVNHTPPKASYEGTPYSEISFNDMPAILMWIKDHREFPSTGFIKFEGNYNWNASIYRYMLNFLMQFSFAAALKVEMKILFSIYCDTEHMNHYGFAFSQLVNYCRTEIKGAPCNCPDD